jgi:hypothetical protein
LQIPSALPGFIPAFSTIWTAGIHLPVTNVVKSILPSHGNPGKPGKQPLNMVVGVLWTPVHSALLFGTPSQSSSIPKNKRTLRFLAGGPCATGLFPGASVNSDG